MKTIFIKNKRIKAAVLSLVAATCMVAARLPQQSTLPPGDPDNGGLTTPDGFETVVVADSTGQARHIVVNENGDIYIKLRYYGKGERGGTVALRDTNKDGKADIIKNFGQYKDEGGLANGVTIHNGYLYFSSTLVVYRSKLIPGQLLPDEKVEVVLRDDHEHGDHWHITKPMAFDNKGNMYVPFGAPSDACQDMVNSPGGQPGSPGLNPCPDLEKHGGVWKFSADKLNQTQKDGSLFATGLRSIVGLRWNSDDESLYAVVHGRDNLHRLFPDLFSSWQSAVLPAEEFVKLKQGSNIGWPYYYYDQMKGKKMLNPEYGGDGKKEGEGSKYQNPLIGFPGHWAPNDLLFYKGDQFPERYKHGAFIAFHGSTNRAPYPQAGYFVAFVPFKNGAPAGPWEVFADGFAGVDPIINVSDAKFRPMGLAEGLDGSLYITDSRQGKLWRIMFKGNKKSFGPAQLAAMEKHKQLAHIRTPDEVKDNLDAETKLAGQRVYNTYCTPCHQRNGLGDGSRFPPLVNSEWVTNDKRRLIEVVTKGLEGPIEVLGKPYNDLMPKHDFIKPAEMAQLLTFVRQNFGHMPDRITEDDIKRVTKKQ
ncbi:PQQ-dependent sugar dehydrogenase [Dyadobacter sandarakinus]|uniref:PQQ-dependent sugar dehydrogenase n=1 Tax=Dyadobacter sandarakinus TaxID=2747268 RepID=A0ABX7IDT6_9BACT|nr:PQQ-dependent sugar dehydrogenase [Dyadobacter sandarakinus]QRR03273.1 PQQ-dependent sugar dehydrogenase [Dyadobacter sandarakinus]